MHGFRIEFESDDRNPRPLQNKLQWLNGITKSFGFVLWRTIKKNGERRNAPLWHIVADSSLQYDAIQKRTNDDETKEATEQTILVFQLHLLFIL